MIDLSVVLRGMIVSVLALSRGFIVFFEEIFYPGELFSESLLGEASSFSGTLAITYKMIEAANIYLGELLTYDLLWLASVLCRFLDRIMRLSSLVVVLLGLAGQLGLIFETQLALEFLA